MITEKVSKNINWDEGVEAVIKKCLLLGNLELAAEVAMKAGRTTEALLIAESGGQKLFDKIKEEYFTNNKDSYIKIFLKSIVQDDYKELVSEKVITAKPHIAWKESLAYIISYLDGKELQELVKDLAEVLLNKCRDINSAIICYILSQQIEIVVDLWKKRTLYQIRKGQDKDEALYLLFEKVSLYRLTCKSNKALLDLDLIVSDVAEFLVHEDAKLAPVAMRFLDSCNYKQANVALMKDRLYNGRQVFMNQKPPQPFQVEKIRVHMSIH